MNHKSLGQKSDDLSVFNDWQSAKIMHCHDFQRFVDFSLGIDRYQRRAHYIVSFSFRRIKTFSNYTIQYVSLSKNPNDFFLLRDENTSDTMGFHDLRSLNTRIFSSDRVNCTSHVFRNRPIEIDLYQFFSLGRAMVE